METIPAAPPPELMADVRAAGVHARRLADAGLEVRFVPRPGRRMSIEVRAGDALLSTLTPAQALELVPRAGAPAGVPRRDGGYFRAMDDDEREIAKLEQESGRVGRQIDEAREDWERKKRDAGVPGAVGDVGEMDADESPATDYPAKD